MPYMVQGQPQGFRLTTVVSGSLLQKIGLQAGDVLQKVNDLTINSPAEAMQASNNCKTNPRSAWSSSDVIAPRR
jgi:type II secretory pathway component PulC